MLAQPWFRMGNVARCRVYPHDYHNRMVIPDYMSGKVLAEPPNPEK